MNLLMNVCHVFTGSFQVCVQYLKEGHLVALAPGGVMEAQFGDEDYRLIWGKRIGFAKVALEAKVVSSFSALVIYNALDRLKKNNKVITG